MEKSMVIILLIICHIATTTVVAQHSMPFPSKGGDSCNVVQVNCGSVAPVNDESASQHLRHPGPPGKRGSKGDLGPIGRAGPQGIKGAKGIIGGVGPAGDKGSQGSKGQQGIKGVKGDAPDYMRIQNMMSATSCRDLNETYGFSTSGYYPLRNIDTGALVSVYCDFKLYGGVTSCKDLNETYGVSTSGYYQIETIDTGVLINVYCNFRIYEGATSCKDLNEIYEVSTSGNYTLETNGIGVLDSVYCDFRVYHGVSNCAELVSRYGISTYGYYRLRINSGHPEYHRCSVFTCEQLKESDGITTSGKYLLGSANNQYEVYCDFSGSDAITEIRHDSMEEVKMTNCDNQGCYSKIPRYTISLIDTIKIIENSRECRQYIKARCQGMRLFRDSFAWWVSRDGEKILYWGGATSRRNNYCACGETSECADSNYKCNCDKNDQSTIRVDEGFLTDKTKLPVKELRFGDMGDGRENGWHTLGKLECMG